MGVAVERNGPVTTVILDQPEVRNAVDGPTAQALADAFRAFDADDEARVAVLWGAGGTFCAGAEPQARRDRPRATASRPTATGRWDPSRMLLRKPVIAAVAGHAVAGGLELALWCDLRVVEEDAVLGVFCRRWGVPLIDGGTVRLPRLVGLGPRARPDPHRPRRRRRRRRSRSASRTASCRPGPRARRPRRWPRSWRDFPQLCMRHDRLSAYEQHDLAARRGARERAAPRARRARARGARRRRPLRSGRGPPWRLLAA